VFLQVQDKPFLALLLASFLLFFAFEAVGILVPVSGSRPDQKILGAAENPAIILIKNIATKHVRPPATYTLSQPPQNRRPTTCHARCTGHVLTPYISPAAAAVFDRHLGHVWSLVHLFLRRQTIRKACVVFLL
jgi:hypothetical protein